MLTVSATTHRNISSSLLICGLMSTVKPSTEHIPKLPLRDRKSRFKMARTLTTYKVQPYSAYRPPSTLRYGAGIAAEFQNNYNYKFPVLGRSYLSLLCRISGLVSPPSCRDAIFSAVGKPHRQVAVRTFVRQLSPAWEIRNFTRADAISWLYRPPPYYCRMRKAVEESRPLPVRFPRLVDKICSRSSDGAPGGMYMGSSGMR